MLTKSRWKRQNKEPWENSKSYKLFPSKRETHIWWQHTHPWIGRKKIHDEATPEETSNKARRSSATSGWMFGPSANTTMQKPLTFFIFAPEAFSQFAVDGVPTKTIPSCRSFPVSVLGAKLFHSRRVKHKQGGSKRQVVGRHGYMLQSRVGTCLWFASVARRFILIKCTHRARES